VRESMGNLRRMAFEEQDGRMLAAQQRLMQIAPQETSQPILLETDVGIVRCGRILEALIAAEQRVVRAAE